MMGLKNSSKAGIRRMIIYRITNKITGKINIGQTTTKLKARMSKHRTHEPKKEKPSIMDFFGKTKVKDRTGKGERINVV